MTLRDDNQFDKSRQRMAEDPFTETRRRIIAGRRITNLLAAANLAAIIGWIAQNLLAEVNLAYTVVYGFAVLASSVGLIFRKEWARKLLGIPAILFGIIMVFAAIFNPAGILLMLYQSYQLAVMVVSVPLLYFLPSTSAYFTASERACARAFAKTENEGRSSPKSE